MKERSILFSAAMVCAILDGRKTQTRRIVKPQPQLPIEKMKGGWWDDGHDHDLVCPYGLPGDRLWVRESWRAHKAFDLAAPSALPKIDGLHYAADPLPLHWDYGKQRPSIHMPRWASRITLEITGIRVERLQEISEEDAEAEGLSAISKDGTLIKYGIADRDGLPGNDDHGWHWQEWERDPRNAYHKLWEQINGAGSAVANPWVWVVEFKRVEERP